MFGPTVKPSQKSLAAELIQELHLDGPVLNEDHLITPIPTLAGLPDDPDVDTPTCLAAWMLDRHARHGVELLVFLGRPFDRTVTQWRNAWALSNEQRDALVHTLKVTARIMQWDELDVAGKKRLLASARWTQGHLLFEAMKEVQLVPVIADELKKQVPALLDEGVNPEPWVTGGDLIKFGLKPGPQFGDWLDQAYDAQLDGTVCDRQQALDWLKTKVLSNPSDDDG